MFGYIRPLEKELLVREDDLYRAAYCGVCLSLGRLGGQPARLTLSYDAAFLALLRMSLTGECAERRRIKCVRHSCRSREAIVSSRASDDAAAIALLLACGKLEDDRVDERGVLRAGARLAAAALDSAKKKISRSFGDAASAISVGLDALSEAERRADSAESFGLDAAAQINGIMLGDATAAGLDGSAARIMREIGISVGRWLYIIDALDDIDEDRRRGRFNPISVSYGRDRLTRDEALTLSCALAHETETALAALELASPEAETPAEAAAICRNILRLGMPAVAARTLDGVTLHDTEQSIRSQDRSEERALKQNDRPI